MITELIESYCLFGFLRPQPCDLGVSSYWGIMLSKQSILPSRGVKGSSTSSSSLKSGKPGGSTGAHHATSSSSQIRHPQISVRAAGQGGKAFSSSSSSASSTPSTSRATNPALSTRMFLQAISAAETLTRGGPLSSTNNSSASAGDGSDNDDNNSGLKGPLDKTIRTVLSSGKVRDGPDGYMHVLRAGLLSYSSQAFDRAEEVFLDVYDGHILQLARVIDELKRDGHCVIGGQIVRPS